MMTTFVQLVIGSILNFMGMAPEAQENPVAVRPDIFIEKEYSARVNPGEDKIWDCFIFTTSTVVNNKHKTRNCNLNAGGEGA